MRVAFLSGGKDSYYAAYRSSSGFDIGLFLVYDFPRPSPHFLNLGKSIETILLTGKPAVVAKLDKGKEFEETVSILKRLGASEIIAGDVYIEDHLKYMESLARESGAALIESLWGLDSEEVLRKEIENGIRGLVLGSISSMDKWIGRELNAGSVDSFIEDAKRAGADPLGENGEYHTIVTFGPMHRAPLSYSRVSIEDYDGYKILRLI
ncbi:MAG: ATPase [Fervidicoccaceae archaeon]